MSNIFILDSYYFEKLSFMTKFYKFLIIFKYLGSKSKIL
ncbi:MAG: hypothetical protein BAJALOKI2v1_40024 [Promethearchaeota archaeon]|nr:MAG: hypothetical protein BAJALOKI2v1_40024 [Candidatus Lokiarchaeota archaeon]